MYILNSIATLYKSYLAEIRLLGYNDAKLGGASVCDGVDRAQERNRISSDVGLRLDRGLVRDCLKFS